MAGAATARRAVPRCRLLPNNVLLYLACTADFGETNSPFCPTQRLPGPCGPFGAAASGAQTRVLPSAGAGGCAGTTSLKHRPLPALRGKSAALARQSRAAQRPFPWKCSAPFAPHFRGEYLNLFTECGVKTQ